MTSPSCSAAPLDVLIVGAGLSGLVAARVLATRFRQVHVIDARQRVGGRLLSTSEGVDLGGSWWWAHDSASAQKLGTELGIASVAARLV